jgi:hypothetical protein
VPSGKTGLGRSSLTGLASELAQNSTPTRFQVAGRYGPLLQRHMALEGICCTSVSLR